MEEVLLIGGALLVYSLLSKINTASKLILSPYQVQSVDLSQIQPVMIVTMRVQNPTNTPLTLISLSGNAYLNSTLVGNIENFLPATFAANSSTLLPVTIQLSWVAILGDLVKALQGGTIRQHIEIDLLVTVQGLPQVEQTLNYVVP
jgi:LEA14-like dessication related protein